MRQQVAFAETGFGEIDFVEIAQSQTLAVQLYDDILLFSVE